MFYLTRTILITVCLTVLSSVSCVSAQNKSCINQLDRWSSGNELKLKGPVKSIRVKEQIYVSEGDFIVNTDKIFLKERFEFGKEGRKSEEYSYTTDGRESPRTTSVYNEKSWLIRQDTYSATTQKPYLETRYIYDKAGNILEAAQYSLDDSKLLQKWSFVQDPTNRHFGFTDTDSRNKWRGRVGFTKDVQCRIREISSILEDGKIQAISSLEFDDKSNPITVVSKSASGEILGKRRFEYEFDLHGNWIKKSDFALNLEKGKSDWKLMNIVYREIEYYGAK